MLIVTNKRSVRKHVIGGRGLFDTIKNVLKRAVASNTSKLSLALMNKFAASELGKIAKSAAKTAGNELATSAISTAKDIAVEKGKQFLEKSRNKVSNIPSASVVSVSSFLNPIPINSLPLNKFPAKRAKKEKGITVRVQRSAIADKSKEMLPNLITMGQQHGLEQTSAKAQAQPQKELNINNLMMGNGLSPSSAMRIEDLVKLGRGIRIS